MAIQTFTRTLSTAASIIATGGGTMDDKTTTFVKSASAAIFVGGSDVTTANGLPVATTDAFAIDLGPGDTLYAVASSGTPTVQVLQTRK